ncbi:alpha/beta-hydrolase [Hymenopellis radicata]|nr:alpha/beta-hydrolase [Hymenopellis radicata]
MSTEQPFKISVSEDKIDLLRRKLDLCVFPDELEDSGTSYGAPLADIRRLVDYWKTGFDWRAQEAALNAELPQFTRDIEVAGFETLNIHYVHQTSQAVGAIPLLFVHGWPGSFLEVRKILPLLTAVSPEHPSFHVVAMSLPGFGFSQAPSKKGFRIAQYAEVGHKLMLALGYNEYVTQGGDWGSLITRMMALQYGGKHVKAWHTNMPLGIPPPVTRPVSYLKWLVTPYTAAEKVGAQRFSLFDKQGRGYFIEQGTQPQTLGYSLADSPVGLLGWIYEKLLSWTDKYPWTDDEVLSWISIYLFSRAGPTASVRIYYETYQSGDWQHLQAQRPSIPMGISVFPAEIEIRPLSWYKTSGNLIFSNTSHTKGGHFAAWETPDVLVKDLHKMFGKGGPAFSVVPGKTGYESPQAQ